MARDLPSRMQWAASIPALLILGGVKVSATQVHVPAFQCASAGALRVTCVGSFLNGESAAGITVRVLDKHGCVVFAGTVDSQGRVTFRRPDEEFQIVFDAGQGKVLTLLAWDVT